LLVPQRYSAILCVCMLSSLTNPFFILMIPHFSVCVFLHYLIFGKVMHSTSFINKQALRLSEVCIHFLYHINEALLDLRSMY
jgi:hypothetical protein